MARALLTDKERRILTGDDDADANYLSVVRSRVKSRISDSLQGDILAIAHHPALLDVLNDALATAPAGQAYEARQTGGQGVQVHHPQAPTDASDDDALTGGSIDEPDEELQAFVDELDKWAGGPTDQVAAARVDALTTIRNLANRERDRLTLRDLLANMSVSVDGQNSSADQRAPNESVYYQKTLRPVLDEARAAGLVQRKAGDDYGFWWTG